MTLTWTAAGRCAYLRGTPPNIEPALIDQDYYFTGNYVQIQGEADLPPVKEYIDNAAADGKSKTGLRFLTLRERRKRCREDALIHSHTKWLSLTDRDWQPQAEWALRLSMSAGGPWKRCLDRAVVRNHFYDEPGRCRVVVLYPCLPQEY